MTHVNIGEYIGNVLATLTPIMPNCFERQNHELIIKMQPEELSAEGTFAAVFSSNAGKVITRISRRNIMGEKKETELHRGISADEAAHRIAAYVKSHTDSIIRRRASQAEFKKQLMSALPDKFKQTCDSKYLSNYSSPKMSLVVKYSDDGTFAANFKYSRKRSETTEIFQYSGTVNAQKAAILAALVSKKYSEA